jgi:hypothetical protein
MQITVTIQHRATDIFLKTAGDGPASDPRAFIMGRCNLPRETAPDLPGTDRCGATARVEKPAKHSLRFRRLSIFPAYISDLDNIPEGLGAPRYHIGTKRILARAPE